MKIKILDVNKKNIFEFTKKKIVQKKYKGKYFKDLNENNYLNYFKKRYEKVDINFIKNYFINSKFNDGSKLFINLMDDNFQNSKFLFMVNFGERISFKEITNDILMTQLKEDNNYLYMKIRKEAFLNTIYNKRSWEDISIGFQNKQYRKPNNYNSKFWFHFTNIYVSKKFVKTLTECSNCNVLNQDIHNILFQDNTELHTVK